MSLPNALLNCQNLAARLEQASARQEWDEFDDLQKNWNAEVQSYTSLDKSSPDEAEAEVLKALIAQVDHICDNLKISMDQLSDASQNNLKMKTALHSYQSTEG